MIPAELPEWLLNQLLLTGFLGLLLLIRQAFFRKNDPAARRRLWYFFMAALVLPYLPLPSFGFSDALPGWTGSSGAGSPGNAGSSVGGGAGVLSPLLDYAVSVERNGGMNWGVVITAVWLVGLLFYGLLLAFRLRRLRLILREAEDVRSEPVLRLFAACREEMGITGRVRLVWSREVCSPASAGLFRRWVILPRRLERSAGESELRMILLHELEHCRRRDPGLLFFMESIRALYWYQPLFRLALRRMKGDMELACDASVLEYLETEERLAYGRSLLDFAGKKRENLVAADWSGPGKLLRERICQITGYMPEKKRDTGKVCRKRRGETPAGKQKCQRKAFLREKVVRMGTAAFLAAALLLCVPFLHLRAEGREPLSAGITDGAQIEIQEEKSWKAAFEERDGVFLLLDMDSGLCRGWGLEFAGRRVSPDSTIKIYSALRALEAGQISPRESVLAWDGAVWPFAAWNRDQDLESAMQASVNWYFQEMDRRAGTETLADFYQSIGYGNGDISGGEDRYWLESTLKISPAEQLVLLKKLWGGELDFREENLEAVKDALRLGESGGTVWYGKTGTGNVEGEEIRGWFIGVIETEQKDFCFISYIQGAENCSGSRAAEIAERILRQEGFQVTLDGGQKTVL